MQTQMHLAITIAYLWYEREANSNTNEMQIECSGICKTFCINETYNSLLHIYTVMKLVDCITHIFYFIYEFHLFAHPPKLLLLCIQWIQYFLL